MPFPELREVCTLLQVFDMPRAARFYCDVLGFTIANRSPTYATEEGAELFHWALLSRGDLAIMLNTAYDAGERPVAPDPVRIAAHADTCLYFACADVDAAFAHLRELAIACGPPTLSPYGMRQLAFHDPDGYAITLQQPA